MQLGARSRPACATSVSVEDAESDSDTFRVLVTRIMKQIITDGNDSDNDSDGVGRAPVRGVVEGVVGVLAHVDALAVVPEPPLHRDTQSAAPAA